MTSGSIKSISRVEILPDSLGVIVKAHGIKGGIRFHSPDPQRAGPLMEAGCRIWLRNQDGTRNSYVVQYINWENHLKGSNMALLILEGLDNRSDVDNLRNCQLFPEGDFDQNPAPVIPVEESGFPSEYLNARIVQQINGAEKLLGTLEKIYQTPAHWVGVLVDENGNHFEIPLVSELIKIHSKNKLSYSGPILKGSVC